MNNTITYQKKCTVWQNTFLYIYKTIHKYLFHYYCEWAFRELKQKKYRMAWLYIKSPFWKGNKPLKALQCKSFYEYIHLETHTVSKHILQVMQDNSPTDTFCHTRKQHTSINNVKPANFGASFFVFPYTKWQSNLFLSVKKYYIHDKT